MQHPRINEAVEAVRTAAADLRVAPYVESTGRGSLRYLQLTAVGADPVRPAAQDDLRALVQVCDAHGRWHANGPELYAQPEGVVMPPCLPCYL